MKPKKKKTVYMIFSLFDPTEFTIPVHLIIDYVLHNTKFVYSIHVSRSLYL